MNVDVVSFLVDVAAVAVVVVGAWFYLRAKTTKTLHVELQQLVQLRGDLIEDLETKVDQLADRVDALEAEMDAVYKIKAKEIADLVIVGVRGVN